MKGAKTIIFSFVSIIALIGLVATLFAAYNNTLQPENDSFDHFSVQTYADGFEFEYVASGRYFCRIVKPYPYTRQYAQIQIDGRWFDSVNSVPIWTFPEEIVFTFDINGVLYNTNFVFSSMETGFEYYVDIPSTVLRVTQPEIFVVGDAWASVDGLNGSIGNAFKVTGQFIKDSIRYQADVFNAVLPWNGMAQGSRSYIASLWSDAEETVEEWREEMNNGEG